MYGGVPKNEVDCVGGRRGGVFEDAVVEGFAVRRVNVTCL